MGHAVAAWLLIALLWIPRTVLADPVENLRGVSEHAIEGMHGGNLSGLVECSGALWAVSDRDDDLLYRLSPSQTISRMRQLKPLGGADGTSIGWANSCVAENWTSKASVVMPRAIVICSARAMPPCCKCLCRARPVGWPSSRRWSARPVRAA
jgi:hypothetical protein